MFNDTVNGEARSWGSEGGDASQDDLYVAGERGARLTIVDKQFRFRSERGEHSLESWSPQEPRNGNSCFKLKIRRQGAAA